MRFEELRSRQVDSLDRDKTILILPLGSVEQHGNHMPLGTDTLLSLAVSIAAAKRIPGRIVVLPPPWYGFSAHHMRFAGSISLRPETLMAVAEDIVAGVIHHGFKRVLLVNGHGGNAGIIDVLASVLGKKHYGKARIAGVTYFQLASAAIAKLRLSEAGGMGHACEFETAMLMHLRPDLVAIEEAEVTYPDPGSPYLTTDLLGSSPVRTFLDFADLSPSGTLGDPALASQESGARFFSAVVDELTKFLQDFRGWTISPADK